MAIREKKNNRENYRVVYKKFYSPYFETKYEKYKIRDICMKAIRISYNGNSVNLGKKLEGRITFFDGETIGTDGKICRIDKNEKEAVLAFTQEIPFKRINKEEFYVMKGIRIK